MSQHRNDYNNGRMGYMVIISEAEKYRSNCDINYGSSIVTVVAAQSSKKSMAVAQHSALITKISVFQVPWSL